MGIFAGSGIGNSSLLSMLARHSDADALVLGRSASAAASSPAFFTKGDEATGQYLGRPVDVKTYLDGSLLVSDDLAGAIWRISPAN